MWNGGSSIYQIVCSANKKPRRTGAKVRRKNVRQAGIEPTQPPWKKAVLQHTPGAGHSGFQPPRLDHKFLAGIRGFEPRCIRLISPAHSPSLLDAINRSWAPTRCASSPAGSVCIPSRVGRAPRVAAYSPLPQSRDCPTHPAAANNSLASAPVSDSNGCRATIQPPWVALVAASPIDHSGNWR